MYDLDHIQKTYGQTSVLKDITAKIPSDEFVFLMGPSGSGKSTLLRLLAYVEVPDKGSVRLSIDGKQFDSSNPERPWPKVTAVFQRQFLWPHLTLRSNISLPLYAAHASGIEKKLNAVIKLFDMANFVDRYPNEVSGGQAQRAALARALILEPQLILIDEAHGGLDLEQQKVLNDYLLKLRASGVGLIVVTHSLDFARQYADRVVVIERGELTEIGPKAIFDQPKSSFLKRVLDL